MKKLKYIVCLFCIMFVIGMPKTQALVIVKSSDTTKDITDKCNKYKKCIEKEIDKAKKDKKKITSSDVQIACQSSRVVASNSSVQGENFDYCDTKHYISLKDLLEKANVQSDNDVYQENIKKCNEARIKARDEACEACQKCANDKGAEDYNLGFCENKCMINNPSACASNNQQGSMEKITVNGDNCKITIPSKSSSGADKHGKPNLNVDFSNGCSILGEDLLSLLADVFHWIRGGCIALVVILGILDFISATASNDADALKKSGTKFVKRVIILALLIVLPTLIEFTLRLIGFTSAAVCFEKF